MHTKNMELKQEKSRLVINGGLSLVYVHNDSPESQYYHIILTLLRIASFKITSHF